MKKMFLLLTVLLFAVTFVAAQKVAIVNDNNVSKTKTEYQTIVTAVENAGYSTEIYDFNNIDTIVYDDISDCDMIIWYVGSDRVAINLWDTTAGADNVKFYPALQEYYNKARGAILLDGIDLILPLLVHTDGTTTNDYGTVKRPYSFADGSFIKDTLGISVWEYESHTDDPSDGVPEADKSSSNTITSLDVLKWKWSSLWRADGWTIVDGAEPLYEMGPDTYGGAGYVMAFKYVNNNVKLYVSSLRIATFGNGSSLSQDTINQLIRDILADAVSVSTDIEAISCNSLSVYPNPATDYFNVAADIADGVLTISDMNGRVVKQMNFHNRAVITTKDLLPGIYIVKLRSGYETKLSKIIIK